MTIDKTKLNVTATLAKSLLPQLRQQTEALRDEAAALQKRQADHALTLRMSEVMAVAAARIALAEAEGKPLALLMRLGPEEYDRGGDREHPASHLHNAARAVYDEFIGYGASLVVCYEIGGVEGDYDPLSGERYAEWLAYRL